MVDEKHLSSDEEKRLAELANREVAGGLSPEERAELAKLREKNDGKGAPEANHPGTIDEQENNPSNEVDEDENQDEPVNHSTETPNFAGHPPLPKTGDEDGK